MRDAVNRFPPGWDEARVRDLIEHYKSQTVMLIPNELVPADGGARDAARYAGLQRKPQPPTRPSQR